MSYTTRCPACGTMFKVVPDQLKISDGWVRCGHCGDVFDATLHLADWVPNPPAGNDPPAPSHGDDEGGDWLHPPAPPASAAEDVSAHEAERDATAVWNALDVSLPAPPLQRTSSDSVRIVRPAARGGEPEDPFMRTSLPGVAAEQERAEFEAELLRFAKVPVPPPVADAAPAIEAPDPLAPAAQEDAEMAPDVASVEPGFMRQARRQAFWRAPAVRFAMVAFAMVLSLTLALQAVLHERDPLAARHPALTPLLARLCQPLGCEVGPLRQIESVSIDSSNLVRRQGRNAFAFELVLKNAAHQPVAVPALELSLTDVRDQVVLRRVFSPEELPGAPRLLPADGTLAISLQLAIAERSAQPMAGYRALVFYP